MEKTGMFVPGMVAISHRILETQKDKANPPPPLYFLEEAGFTYDEITDTFKKNKLIIPMALARTLTEDTKEMLEFMADNNFFFVEEPELSKGDPIISNHYSVYKFFESVFSDRFEKDKVQKTLDKNKKAITQ